MLIDVKHWDIIKKKKKMHFTYGKLNNWNRKNSIFSVLNKLLFITLKISQYLAWVNLSKILNFNDKMFFCYNKWDVSQEWNRNFDFFPYENGRTFDSCMP